MILLQLIQYENSTNFNQKKTTKSNQKKSTNLNHKKSTNLNHKKIHQFKPQEIHQLLSAIYLPEHMSVFPYWKHFWFPCKFGHKMISSNCVQLLKAFQ